MLSFAVKFENAGNANIVHFQGSILLEVVVTKSFFKCFQLNYISLPSYHLKYFKLIFFSMKILYFKNFRRLNLSWEDFDIKSYYFYLIYHYSLSFIYETNVAGIQHASSFITGDT